MLDLIPDELGGNKYFINGNVVSLVDAGKWSKQYDDKTDAGENLRKTDSS